MALPPGVGFQVLGPSEVRQDHRPTAERLIMENGQDNPFEGVRARTNVDHMFRAVHQRQTQMSAMSDQKANILIGASFLILTLVFGQARAAGLSPALVSLGLTAAAAAFFAGLVVFPRVRGSWRPTAAFNPLFFSYQASLEEDRFTEVLADIVKDDAEVFKAIARDLHQSAKVLERKYRFVRLSYIMYFVGVPVSFLLFLLG